VFRRRLSQASGRTVRRHAGVGWRTGTRRPWAEAGVRRARGLADRPMIRLDNISKQNGHQILFIEASMGVQKGE
jgi:hypothetical protein